MALPNWKGHCHRGVHARTRTPDGCRFTFHSVEMKEVNVLHRVSRFGMVIVFVGLLLVAGAGDTPVHASHGDSHIRNLVHRADISDIMSLIHRALDYGGGLSHSHHDTVYNALGRTNTALDLLYSSSATGDVFNAAERLLLTQHDLLVEVERFTLSGNLEDLSTVAPLLVDLAQARVAFERQAGHGHSTHLPSTGSRLSRGLLHDRSPSHSLSTLRHRSPSHSFSSGLYHPPGRTFLELRRSRTFDHFGHRGLGSHSLNRFHR